jgi:hypothetical protein
MLSAGVTRVTIPWPLMSDGRHDFDFLHGSWTIRNRRRAARLEGSEEWLEFDSSARVRPILLGLGNEETISIPDLPGTGPFEGHTTRLFDPAAKTWSIFWASTGAPGRMDPPLTGAFEDGEGVFYGEDTFEGRPVRVRFDWIPDGSDRARWQQSYSDDDGSTWELDWVMDFSRA